MAVGVAAALLVGLGYVVTRPTGLKENAPAAGTQPSSPSGDAVVLPMLFLPGSSPDGFKVSQVLEQPATTPDPKGVQRIVIGQRLPDDGYGPTITLTSGPPDWILATDGEIRFERRPATIATGEAAEFLWWGSANERLSLQYVSTSGRAVSISANAVAQDAPIADALLAVANATAVIDTGAQVLSSLPDGYEVLAVNTELSDGGQSLVVGYTSIDNSGRAFTITSQTHPPSGFPFTALSNDKITPIQVRGHDGYVSRHDYPRCNCPTVAVTWLERADLQITITGDSLTIDELTSIAEGLKPADESDWAALATAPTSSFDNPTGSAWADGAALRIYLAHGSTPDQIEAVRSALAEHPDIIDANRLTYLDETATLAAAQLDLASDPGGLSLLTAANTPSRFNVFAASNATDAEVDELVKQAGIASLTNVSAIVRPG